MIGRLSAASFSGEYFDGIVCGVAPIGPFGAVPVLVSGVGALAPVAPGRGSSLLVTASPDPLFRLIVFWPPAWNAGDFRNETFGDKCRKHRRCTESATRRVLMFLFPIVSVG